jgi:translocation and assembly module TamB
MLDVESGLLRFNGPYDNPALDVLALRPHRVRAGVQVSGTARRRACGCTPTRAAGRRKALLGGAGPQRRAGGAEAAVLQQAALALLGRGGGDLTGDIARQLGLDEIGVKGPQAGADASEAALTLGKRLTRTCT